MKYIRYYRLRYREKRTSKFRLIMQYASFVKYLGGERFWVKRYKDKYMQNEFYTISK